MRRQTEADREQLEREARLGRAVMGRAATLGWKNDGECALEFLLRTTYEQGRTDGSELSDLHL